MFDKKMEFEESKGAETIVGASVKLKGTLKSDGNITINGSVSGEIITKADVSVGGSADLKANIAARNINISGIIQGNIKAENELRITETGKVYGDIQVKTLNIASGAVFSGKSIMLEKGEAVERSLSKKTDEDAILDKAVLGTES
ncbi:MAG: polymer-forming cytoskeletal protein [Patescibacteria group bacterium]|nr:polymer-forming cytoskeletal protein [Patescibacteria group bacterium]